MYTDCVVCFFAGCRTVSNNGSGSGLAPAQNILAVRVHLSTIFEVQVWFRFTQVKYYWFRFGLGSLEHNFEGSGSLKLKFCWFRFGSGLPK